VGGWVGGWVVFGPHDMFSKATLLAKDYMRKVCVDGWVVGWVVGWVGGWLSGCV